MNQKPPFEAPAEVAPPEVHLVNAERLNEYYTSRRKDPEETQATLDQFSRFVKPEVTSDEGAFEKIAAIHEDPDARMYVLGNHAKKTDPVALGAVINNTPLLDEIKNDIFILSKPSVHKLGKSVPFIGKYIRKKVESVGSVVVWRKKDIAKTRDPEKSYPRHLVDTVKKKIGLEVDEAQWVRQKRKLGMTALKGLFVMVQDLVLEGDTAVLYPGGGRDRQNPRQVEDFQPGLGKMVMNTADADLKVYLMGAAIAYPNNKLRFRKPAMHISLPVTKDWEDAKDVTVTAKEIVQEGMDHAFNTIDSRKQKTAPPADNSDPC